MKRFIDILLSVIALCIFFPIMVIIAIFSVFENAGQVIFSQTRSGRNGLPFKMYKFRTMTNKTNQNGDLLPDEKRITTFGSLLRSTSLDELPELWNVLKGDMSLVGPRPLLPEYLSLYSAEQFRRHEVKPGITGWAQINGRNTISWKQKFELDVWYVDNRSLLLDLKVLCLTVVKVTRREGVSQTGRATADKFTGNDHG